MSYARRVDTTHKPIKQTLEAAGFFVVDCSRFGGGFPDLIATKHRRAYFIECKSSKKVRMHAGDGLGQAQKDLIEAWKGPPIIVAETPEDALRQINLQIREV